MLDPQLLRTDLENTAAKLAARGYQLDLQAWQSLEQDRKTIQVETEALQNKRTTISKSIGQAKAKVKTFNPCWTKWHRSASNWSLPSKP